MDVSSNKITLEQLHAASALLKTDLSSLTASISSTANLNQAFLAYQNDHDEDSDAAKLIYDLLDLIKRKNIEFLGSTGVNLYDENQDVLVFRGENALFQLWSDMNQTIPDNGERYVYGVNEEKFQDYANVRFYTFLEQLRQRNIKTKILVDTGNYNFVDPTAEYRWISQISEGEMPHFIYGDKYALLMWYPTPRVIVINNKELAGAYKKVFFNMWTKAITPRLKS